MKKGLWLSLFAILFTSLSWTAPAQAQPQFGGNIGITQRLSAIDGNPVGPGGATNAPVGSTVTWEISVRNGPVAQVGGQPVSIPANDVQLRELFSGPFTLNPASISSVPAGVTCNAPAVSTNITEIFCDIGSMAPNATVTIFMSGTVDGEGQIDKVGTVNDFFAFISDNTTLLIPLIDFNPIDNVATASVVAGDGTAPQASLLVSKTVRNLTPGGDNTLPLVGETVEYEILVGNFSATDFAGGVLLTDITMGAIQMAVPPSGPDWFCASLGPNPPTPPSANNFIYCLFLGNIPAGGLTPPLLLQGTVLAEGLINNTVTVQPIGAEDTFLTDNTATVSIMGVAVPPDRVNLSLSKVVDGPTLVSPGDTVLNRIVITNPDLTAVTAVVITDTLSGPHNPAPAGINFITVPAGFGCSAAQAPNQPSNNATVISCLGGPVPASSSSTVIEYEYVVNDFGQNDNIACISAVSAEDTVSSNNCSVASTIAVNAQLPPADLRIRKSVDNVSPIVGNQVQYTIQVRNTGPNPAIGAEITDTIFGNILLDTVVDTTGAPGWDCTVNQGAWFNQLALPTPRRIRCSAVGPLAPSANQNIVITGTVQAPGPITDSVTVSAGGTYDPNLSDNTAAVTVVATDAPAPTGDLGIDKTVVSPALPYNLGDGPITFQIDVTNNSGPDQTDVVVVDNILGDFNIAEVTGTIAGCTGGLSVIQNTVYCTIAALPAGVTHNITYQLTPLSEHVLHNIANVVGAIADTDPTNDTVALNVAVGVDEADLSITKTVDNPNAGVGDQVTFTINVTNTDPTVTALGVNVSDIMSGPIQLDSATVTTGGTCTPNAGPLGTPLIIDCNPGGTNSIAPNTTAIIEVVGTVLGQGQIDNIASVSSSLTADPNTSNNSAVASVIGNLPSVDLSVTKSAAPNPAQVGDTVTFTVVLSNPGPDPVTNVILTDHVSGPIENIGNFSQPGCGVVPAPLNNPPAWIITCTAANLPVGNFVLTYDGDVNGLGQIDNIVSITSMDAIDSNLSNNSAVASVNGTPQEADLSITKEVDNPYANVGDTVTFTVNVTNNGPDTATMVRVTDIVSGPLVNVTAPGCAVDSSNPPVVVITCDLNTLNSGETQQITIQGDVDDQGQIDNIASVADLGTSPPTTDPDLSNNSAVASVVGDLPLVDISLTKSVSPNPAQVGDIVTYTVVVTNPGPDPVTNVTLTDHVSGPITNIGNFVGANCIASPAVLNPPATNITCTAPVLPVGNFVVTYEGEITGLGQVDNIASITSMDAIDSNLSNNSAVASVNGIPQMADLSVTKSVDNPNATIGDTITFTVNVTNNGPDTATMVRLTDIISGPLVNVVAAGCNVDDTNPPVTEVTCDLNSVNSGETQMILIMGDVADLGQIDNIASVADLGVNPPTTDPDLSNNSAVASVIGNQQEADLSVIKQAENVTNPGAGTSGVVGDIIRFTSTVTNNGPTNIAIGNGQFTEHISGPVINVTPMAPAGVNCGPVTTIGNVNTFTCTNTGIFNSGAMSSIVVEAEIAAPGGAISNTVSVGAANTFDPNLTNNVATADINGNPAEADLTVVKEVDISGGTSIGDTVVFTISVDNNGPADATNVVVTDQLIAPAGVFAVTDITSNLGDICTPDAPPEQAAPLVLNCTIGTLAMASPPVVITVTGRVDGLGQIENTAVVTDTADPQTGTPATSDPNVSNNVSVASTVGIPTNVDLSITKDVDLSEATPLEDVTFTIVVTNNGAVDAQGVVITDVTTGPFDINSMTMSDGGACSPDSGSTPPVFVSTCTPLNGVVQPGNPVTITVVGRVTGTGQVDNTASVSSSITTDPIGSNNIAVASTIGVPTPVDLSITKTVDDPQATSGDTVTFTVRVENNDAIAQTALGVMITDLMTGPINVTVITVTEGSGTCQPTPSLPAVAQPFMSIVCIPDNGEILTGEAFEFTVAGEITDEGQVDNVASVDNVPAAAPDGVITEDPNTSNNTAVASVIGDLRADLRVLKDVLTPLPVAVGDTVTYMIEVFNDGPNTATGVVVTDMNLGPFTAFANISAPANCTLIDDNNMNCTLPDIPSMSSVSFTYDVVPNQPGFWFNIATVSSTVFDPTLANNTISANLPVEVTELADLEIMKTADADEVKTGDEVNYTIVVTNNGPQDATNVIMSDFTAGPFDSIINVATDVGSCNAPDQGLITCTAGSLPVGNSMTITYTIVTGMPGTLSDLATVGGEVLDPVPDNNADAYQVKVLSRQADLEIHKQVGPNPVPQTTEVTYTLTVKNNGPDVAENVWVIDEISGGFESVTATADNGGACSETVTSETTSTVKCELGDLAVDETVTIIITVTASGDVSSVLSNLASVSSDTEDPVLANNTTSADTLTIEAPPAPPSNVQVEGSGGTKGGCSLQEDTPRQATWLVWCLAAGLWATLAWRTRRKVLKRVN